jgi:radical SAM/Cys-rich protein
MDSKCSIAPINSQCNSQAYLAIYLAMKTQTLTRRNSPLSNCQNQIHLLNTIDLSQTTHQGDFDRAVNKPLAPTHLDIFQINLGKLCNMTCKHCHVDAGPDRTTENMDLATIEACLNALDQTQAHTVDLTGGAPELNPHFEYLVDQCVQRGKQVIDRCNLTVLLLPTKTHLPQWLADRNVEVVCSLPHYRKRNTDLQRGDGTFEQSIEALRRLNAAGYGQGHPNKRLTLMSNPVGAFLSGNQAQLETEWKAGLDKNFGIQFDRLITLNNMPISRYLEWLENSGNLQSYMTTLVNAFNPATLNGLMCRNTLSVSWDGKLYDCDFNQMLDLKLKTPIAQTSIHNFDLAAWTARTIVTDRHCFGCTAGAGSSCGGAISNGNLEDNL